MADRDPTLEPERPSSLDHELGLPGAELPAIVQMQIESRAGGFGRMEDPVEVPRRIAVVFGGVEPADDVDALAQRLLK